jgi:hypothetical protein
MSLGIVQPEKYKDNFEDVTVIDATFTGPWAADKACTIKISRIGKVVFFNLGAVAASASNASEQATIVEAIPEQYRPVNADGVFLMPMSVVNGDQINAAFRILGSTGIITIFGTGSLDPFTQAVSVGWPQATFSWIIA